MQIPGHLYMSPRPHRLLESERTYLGAGRAPGSYRPHELDAKVDEKVSLLPDRVRALQADVELLDEAGRLDADTWGLPWLDLLGARDADGGLEAAFTYDEGEHEVTDDGEVLLGGSVAATFGNRLGELVGRLLLTPEGTSLERVCTDVVWGFCLGIGPDRMADRYRFAETCSERMTERATTEARAIGTWWDDLREDLERWKAAATCFSAYVESVLRRERGIDPEEWVVRRVEKRLEDERGANWLREVVDDGRAPSSVVPPERILECYDESGLDRIRALAFACEAVRGPLRSTTWDGITPGDVLGAMVPSPSDRLRDAVEPETDPSVDSDGFPRSDDSTGSDHGHASEQRLDTGVSSAEPATIETVAARLEAPDRKPAVAKLCRFLAGDDDVDGDSWPGPPAIELETDADRYTQWRVTLTPFGRALRAYTAPDRESEEAFAFRLDPFGDLARPELEAAHRRIPGE